MDAKGRRGPRPSRATFKRVTRRFKHKVTVGNLPTVTLGEKIAHRELFL